MLAYMRIVIGWVVCLAAGGSAMAQVPACWPKDLQGGTGSAAVVVRSLLSSGAVREQDAAQCAVGWACVTTYTREIEVALFDRCSAPLDQIKPAALTALAEARTVPAWAAQVLQKCDSSAAEAPAVCRQAVDAVVTAAMTPPAPAFAASAPTLYDSAGVVSKELAAIPGAACACASTSHRRIVGKELRCVLAGTRAPEGLFAACNRR